MFNFKSPKDDDLTLKPPNYKDIIALTFDFFSDLAHGEVAG